MIWRRSSSIPVFQKECNASFWRNRHIRFPRILCAAAPGMRFRGLCSAMSIDQGEALAAAAASELLGAPVESIERVIGNGRNSRIYRVRTRNENFALKQYPAAPNDDRDRLGAETQALRLMQQYGIDSVPRVAAVHRQQRFVLLTWIDCEAVGSVME